MVVGDDKLNAEEAAGLEAGDEVRPDGYASSSRRSAKRDSTPSRLALMRLMVLAENVWPHSSSVIAFTFRVDTPCTYISANALTSAFSER